MTGIFFWLACWMIAPTDLTSTASSTSTSAPLVIAASACCCCLLASWLAFE
jgi:hypothetical protein